jgi:hypothetical protein
MSRFPGGVPLLRGGFVFLDPVVGTPLTAIAFQFNPDTLTRTLQPQTIGTEPGDRLEALRLKGPPHETYKFDAEFDATDVLDQPGQHVREATEGLGPALSMLEVSMYPTVAQLLTENQLAGMGLIEIAPAESPLTVLVLGRKRVVPVRITDFSVTEEAFSATLDPIRARVAITVRVLTVDDLGFSHKGGQLYLQYHRQKDRWAAMVTDSAADLGLTSI